MPLGDLLADRQPDASAGVLVAPVEPLKQDEDALLILRSDPDPIIAYREEPGTVLAGRRDVDTRRLVAPELERVADQVLEKLSQADRIGLDGREEIVGDGRAALLDA